MNIEPIAHFCSPFTSKFGIPRQAGIVPELRGQIVFEPKYRNADALRGLEQFDYLWIIWGFSSRKEEGVGRKENSAMTFHPTVRPPLLGGNERRGVWATRSPFRPNGLGLSSVRIDRIENGVIHVLGADLMDGTPIYDIKPYLEYVDSHTGVRSGFVDERQWQRLEVVMADELRAHNAPIVRTSTSICSTTTAKTIGTAPDPTSRTVYGSSSSTATGPSLPSATNCTRRLSLKTTIAAIRRIGNFTVSRKPAMSGR
jgi:tRNA-Thr(GGU) m(6)t(6)A37 methyltransferase TsaA